MEEKAKKSRLAGIPAWVWSLMTVFASFWLLMIFELFQIPVTYDIVFIISYVILITAACFFICRTYPKSVWYTPFICNVIIIFFVIKDVINGDIWTTFSEWISMVSIIVLSVIVAIVGAKIGRRKINQAN